MSIESRSKQYGGLFGDWHIGRRLDEGANSKSAVFELYRTSNGWTEYSALKVIGLIEESGDQAALPPYRRTEYSTAAQQQRNRAEREVRLMEQLRGKTNIVDYLDHSFFEWRDETGFGVDLLIRMELLKSLRADMRAGRQFSEDEIRTIGRDIGSALILCHGKNIVHRDIKPENIFYNKDGDYKLGDFGISKIMDGAVGAAATTGVYTPAYAAPEQARGRCDKRSDIYSLGLVLYELCNGNRLPFAKSSYIGEDEIRLRLAGTPLPPPGQLSASGDPYKTSDANKGAASGDPYKTTDANKNAARSALSDDLIKTVMKACAFQSEDRFATAEELVSALRGSSSTPPPPPPPPPPGWWEKLLKTLREKRGVIASVLLIAAVLAGVFLALRNRDEKKDPRLVSSYPTPQPTQQLKATPAPTAAPASDESAGEEGALPDLNAVAVGDVITLGRCEQDGDLSDGSEEIEWLVLRRGYGRVLVVSRNILERIVYDSQSTGTSPAWDDSAVCLWLNGAFYRDSFTADEQDLIQTVTTPNTVRDSQDKLFLLSRDEAQTLFDSDAARSAVPTAFIAANNSWTAWRAWEEEEYDKWSAYGETAWLLRPDGLYSDCAVYVDGSGEIQEAYGNGLNDFINGVRPAMWLTIG